MDEEQNGPEARDRPPADAGSKATRARRPGRTAVPRPPKYGQVIVPLRERRDGWTAIRQRAFLRALSELGSVRDACALVGLSKTSAYRLRTLSSAFAEAWDKALEMVAPILEQAAFERGVEGWDEPVFYLGEIVGYKKRYSDHALRLLLQRQRGGVGRGRDLSTATQEELATMAREAALRAGGEFCTRVSTEAVRASILKKIEAIERHDRVRWTEAEGRGKLWLERGCYPPDATVRELAAKAAEAQAV